ncbi:MAG TPA: glycoside hydrolase family 2 TIM barrel-domain containing protein [Prolixibacteraceae bacterium]|nr:glycoside hydrolase family 2 TIM barrel-domain containing protein [Prolixibacteraceae bacterium]
MRNLQMRLNLVLTIILLFGLFGCQKPIFKTNFNDDWQFAITSEAVDQTGGENIPWENISLPHTPTIEPKVVNNQWQGICWYRKQFKLDNDAKGKKLFLKFDGAMNVAEVWVNGQKITTHIGGYLPVICDFTEAALPGETNTVLVRLDNNDNPVTGPKPLAQLDFNTYGGLYRDAFLIIKNPVHISDPILANKVAGGGVFVTYPTVSKEEATVQVKTNVKNDGSKTEPIVVLNEIWKGNTLVASKLSPKTKIESHKDVDITETLEVKQPDLWSPKSPSLYTLKTKVLIGRSMVDVEETTIGIRHIQITKEGFFINGEKMFLRGVNRHQEYPYIGYALSNEAQYRDAVKIKEAGFDYIRLSHYPHSPAFMDACDKLGLVVLDAILGWQYYSTDTAFQQQIFQTGHDLIRRDRNHPCVIAWELSLNESWMDEPFIDQLQKITHEEYPGDQCYSAGWQEYGYDIYLQARQHRLGHYKETGKPYIVSEYGDWEYYAMNAGLNQDNWGDLKQADRSSRQLLTDGEIRLLQQATNIQEAHNDNFNTTAIADGYWDMFDYNRGYSPDLEASGVMSIDRLPKFSYYFFQSQRDAAEKSELYQSGPMVFIASYWNEQSPLNVRVFSNCDEVELLLNGKSQGLQKPDQNTISNHLNHPPFTFNLKAFEKGELIAKGFIGGKEVASRTIHTPETPSKFELKIDESGCAPKAGVNDVVFVVARLVDSNGTVVPLNGVKVNFQIEGDAKILNPEEITTEAGIATALIRIGSSLNEIKITVHDLENRNGEIQFRPL